LEIGGNRIPVCVREPCGVSNDLGHRATDKIEIGCLPVLQQSHDVILAPAADARFRIGGYIWHSLAAWTRRRASQLTCRIASAEPITRRMTVTASPNGRNQIATTVQIRVFGSFGLRRTGEAFDDGDDRTPRARRRKYSGEPCGIDPGNSWYAVQKGFQIDEITITQAAIEGKRKGRQIMRVVRRDTPPQRSGKVGEAPPANPGFSVGRDVRRDDSAERRFERATARIGPAAILGVGVALVAARRRREGGAACYSVCVFSPRREAAEGQEDDGESCRQSFNFSRNVSWQAPQPFFPRSPNAVWMVALSPLLMATSSTSALPAAIF